MEAAQKNESQESPNQVILDMQKSMITLKEELEEIGVDKNTIKFCLVCMKHHAISLQKGLLFAYAAAILPDEKEGEELSEQYGSAVEAESANLRFLIVGYLHERVEDALARAIYSKTMTAAIAMTEAIKGFALAETKS